MRDLSPYEFPDGDADSQDRFIDQQLAASSQKRRVSSGDRSVEHQDIAALIKLKRYQREERNRATRMFTVYSEH